MYYNVPATLFPVLRRSEREQGQFSVPGGGVRGVGGEQRCVWVGGVSINYDGASFKTLRIKHCSKLYLTLGRYVGGPASYYKPVFGPRFYLQVNNVRM